MSATFSETQTSFADINGVRIAYRVLGQGTPILLYNRFRGVLDTWDPLFLDSLASNHSLVLFDYPGIGDSEGALPADILQVADTGIQLMDKLGFKHFHVMGWSYGGLVAQAALFRHNERIDNAVLIGTNPPGNNEVPFDKLFMEHALKPENTLDDETVLFFEPASPKSANAARASHERIGRRLDRSKIPATADTFKKYFEGSAIMRTDAGQMRSGYRSLENPVLVISGDHDISFAVENWFPLLRNAPSMQHLILNDAGHGPQHQEPELIAGYIKVFLEPKARP